VGNNEGMTMSARTKLHRGHVRLAQCPHCAGRRRVLVEIADKVRGRCIDCGAELPVPLATERCLPHVIVGRAGQTVVEPEADDLASRE